MKQGDRFLRLVMLLLAAACLSYFGAAAIRSLSAPLTTVTALETQAEVSAKATGYVVRDEVPLTSYHPVTVPLLSEGEKAAAGQTVAIGCEDGSMAARIAEKTALQRRIRQLSCAAGASPRSMGGEIRSLLASLAAQPLRSGSQTDRLKGFILRSSGEEGPLTAELKTLEEQYAALTASISGTELTVSCPGWFSSAADGFEGTLTPEALTVMTAADLSAPEPEPVSRAVYGRLIRSARWYFVTVLPHEQLHGAEEGDAVALTFAGNLPEAIPMRVERIDRSKPDACLLVLSCGRHLQEVTTLRQQSCTLVFHTYAGLRVPRAAIHLDEAGNTGVYVIEGASARWKPVEILCTDAESCVAALDQTDTDHLWPGDEILLGSNLYDGKVVYP